MLMKKTTIKALLLSLALTAVMLSGCGGKDAATASEAETQETVQENAGEDETAASGGHQTSPEAAAAVSDPDNADTKESASSGTQEGRPEYHSRYRCEMTIKNSADGLRQSGVLRAYDEDGNVAWTYTTKEYEAAETDAVQGLTDTPAGYIFVADGTVYCVGEGEDKEGQIIWQNDAYGGAGTSFDLDDDYNLYLSGYYSPDLFIVNQKGETVARYESFAMDYFWPYEVRYQGNDQVLIRYDSNGNTLLANIGDGSAYVALEDTVVEAKTVQVDNVDDMMAAIDNYTTIVLAPGVYNISEYLAAHPELPYANSDGGQSSALSQEEVFDGVQIDITGINHLTIRSADTEDRAQIICEPRYADVLSFVSCSSIHLDSLVIGHSPEEGSCEGDVLAFEVCDGAEVYNCDLYGCGAYALEAVSSSGIGLYTCTVHSCSYGCAVIHTSDVGFVCTTFSDCREYTMFELLCSSAVFTSCTFRDLDGDMIYLDTASTAEFYGCIFDVASMDSVRNNEAFSERITLR